MRPRCSSLEQHCTPPEVARLVYATGWVVTHTSHAE